MSMSFAPRNTGNCCMSNDAVDISIVIPTHNRTTLLIEAIDSALAQTKPAREIIVVDDGSGPETAAIVAKYERRLKYVRQANAGQQAARNKGVEVASGSWVATLDDDDVYQPEYLEHVSQAIKGSSADMVYSDHLKFGPNVTTVTTNFSAAPPAYWDTIEQPRDGMTWSEVERFPLEKLLEFVPFYPSTMSMRKDFYLKIGGYDPRIRGIKSEDLEFLARALRNGKLAVIWKALVHYRCHDSNSTKSVINRVLGRWRVFEIIRQTHDLTPEFASALDLDLPDRRAHAFDLAFTARELDTVNMLAPRLRASDWTASRRSKHYLTKLPRPLAITTLDLLKSAKRIAGART
jgi:glycosyltransferase involved in cell wall biosynthesis